MNQALATIPKRASLVEKFAAKYSIEPDKLMSILKATAFKVKDGEVSNEQMAALLVVADQYGLNPFTKEIFAFPDKKNGIVPVVGVDGWSRIINDHPQCDGFEFRDSEEMVTLPDAKPCPKWMEVVVYRKDRAHATVVREYLDEVYRPLGKYSDGNKMTPGPWQTHTKRFLRHKVLIQGGRIAFGFSGIYDEDEANRIVEREINPMPETAVPTEKSAGRRLAEAVGVSGKTVTDISETKPEPTDPIPTIKEAIHALGWYDSEAAIGLYADGLPDALRSDSQFAAGVKARLAELKSENTPPAAVSTAGPRAGTPKIRKIFAEKLNTCTDPATLDLILDESRSYAWANEDRQALQSIYEKRRDGLVKP